MNRDMGLIREILLWAIEQERGTFGENPEIPEYSEEQVAYHVFLMSQAGLVNAADISDMDSESPAALLMHLNWDGHDFIDAAKNNTAWNKAKSNLLSSGASFTFEILKEYLRFQAKQQLGIP